jgi:hypothetical protein
VIFVWARTAVQGQSLQAHKSFDILSQLHYLPATLAGIDRLHLRLQTTTAGQMNPTRQTSEHACDFASQICGQTRHRPRRGRFLPNHSRLSNMFRYAEATPHPVLLKSNSAATGVHPRL